MTPQELDNQVRNVLPAILTKIGLPVLSSIADTLPPFALKHRRCYRKGLSLIEESLENLATRGRRHEKTLDLVRDCLTELHQMR